MSGRKYHLPAGRFNTPWLGEILNLRSENALLIVKVSTLQGEKCDLTLQTWELST
jgi:hypothetical protein